MVVGNVEQTALPFPPGSVDCIICADLLEHTADPWTVVANLKKLLKPTGCIVASIPNVGFHRNIRRMIRGKWLYTDEGLLDRTHLRFFTFETIEEMFARNGMVGVNINYRLAPRHPWPAGGEDVAAAIQWVRRSIAQYGGDVTSLVPAPVATELARLFPSQGGA